MTIDNSQLLVEIEFDGENSVLITDVIGIDSCNFIDGYSFEVNQWKQVSIPLRDLPFVQEDITRFSLQNNEGNDDQTFCIFSTHDYLLFTWKI
jgi:hypothetical protein